MSGVACIQDKDWSLDLFTGLGSYEVLFSICDLPWVIEVCEFNRHELLSNIELSVHVSQREGKDLYHATNIIS
jgi:hypothetical protein